MTNTTEEKNLAYKALRAKSNIARTLEFNKELFDKVESILASIADNTQNSDLEDACSYYIDDILPVLKMNMEGW